MAQSSRVALKAFESLQRQAVASFRRSQPQKSLQLYRSSSPRCFSTRAICLAAATPQAQPAKSATASAAGTESALSTESSSNPVPSPFNEQDPNRVDWSKSFHGLAQEAFPKDAADILLAPIDQEIVEIKPDGIIYLPEIHYRRILNRAFGPGAWGLAPRGETIVTDKSVTREYALVAHGRLVSIARGEQDYFSKDNIPTASEGCKSNAMMRCCKDLGIASELWDPRFIARWKTKYAREAFVENQATKKRTKLWIRKGDPIKYPFKETSSTPIKPST